MTESAQQEIPALQKFQRQLSRTAFGATVVIALVCFGLNFKEVARGLLLGSLFSVLNFGLMAHALPRQIGYTRRKATAFAFLSIVLRFVLLAVPLIIAFKFDSFNWIAVVVGLFTVPLAILFDHIILQRFSPKRVHP
jgi:hypothetical protein